MLYSVFRQTKIPFRLLYVLVTLNALNLSVSVKAAEGNHTQLIIIDTNTAAQDKLSTTKSQSNFILAERDSRVMSIHGLNQVIGLNMMPQPTINRNLGDSLNHFASSTLPEQEADLFLIPYTTASADLLIEDAETLLTSGYILSDAEALSTVIENPEALPDQFSENAQSTSESCGEHAAIPFASFLALTYCITGITGPNADFFRAAIAAIATPYLGQSLDQNTLGIIQDEVTRFYIQGGYITSRATPPTVLADGTLIIHVVEGTLHDIQVETVDGESFSSASPLLEQYVKTQIEKSIPSLGNGPVNFTEVENAVRLLALDPLFVPLSVYSVLSSAENGASNLTIRVQEANRLEIDLAFNNYSPPSLGAEGFDWQVGFNINAFAYGERLYTGGRYNPFVSRGSSRTIITTSEGERSEFGGSDNSIAWFLGYSRPLGTSPRGGLGRLGFQVGRERKDVLQGLAAAFDFRSEVERFSVDYRYPISRTLWEEWTLIGGFTREEGQTFINKTRPFRIGFGPNDEGISRTSTFSLALEYLRRGSSNVFLSRGQINFGTGLFDATKNEAPLPDAQFVSLFLQAQTSQRLSGNHVLIVRGLAQLTPNNLLPINQFVIGGSQSVRGYRENLRSGDNGLVINIEDRIGFLDDINGRPRFEVVPFLDLGLIWNNGSNPNILPDGNLLASLGVGLRYQPFTSRFLQPLRLSLDYGFPLVPVEGSGNNLQDKGLHFGVSYSVSFF